MNTNRKAGAMQKKATDVPTAEETAASRILNLVESATQEDWDQLLRDIQAAEDQVKKLKSLLAIHSVLAPKFIGFHGGSRQPQGRIRDVVTDYLKEHKEARISDIARACGIRMSSMPYVMNQPRFLKTGHGVYALNPDWKPEDNGQE